MESFERMNDVVAYVENNLTGNIDFSRIARIACCPTHQFLRIFAFITDMSLNDYIRRRRLSLAAQELQRGQSPIIEVALKYGYDTHASFTRAFREQHGMAPSSARGKGAAVNLVPRMAFDIPPKIDPALSYRVEKGTIKMARISKIGFTPFGPYRIVGKEIRTRTMAQNIPALWGRCFTDGTYDRLMQMEGYIPTDIPNEYIGYIRDYDPQDRTFTYLVGMFMQPGTPVPEGYSSYEIPACTLAQAWVEGEEYDIYANASALTREAIHKSGYAPDDENFFQCEVYTDERFGIPKSNGERVLTLDYYMPCMKLR